MLGIGLLLLVVRLVICQLHVRLSAVVFLKGQYQPVPEISSLFSLQVECFHACKEKVCRTISSLLYITMVQPTIDQLISLLLVVLIEYHRPCATFPT